MKITRYDKLHLEGLSVTEVTERIQANLINDTESNTRSYFFIVFSNVFTFFNFIFVGLAIWLISVGAYSDLVFMSVVLLNMSIGIFQEVRAKQTVDKLSIMNAPTAHVVRDSVAEQIPSKEVVLDDIIILQAGNQVPADSIIKSGTVEVNESLLTGESDLIKKTLGDTLLAGSFIVSGICYARVDACGKSTYVSKLTKEGKVLKKPKSEILTALNYLIRIVGLIILPIGYFSYRNSLALGLSSVETVVKTSASIIGIIPAGLYLTTSIALAVSSMRLAKNNALVQDLYCIEMLARVDCICLDKTGTITDGTMSVEEFIPVKPKGKSEKLISSMMHHLLDSNQTADALKEYFGSDSHYDQMELLPFSSERKYSAVRFKRIGTYVLGAPEFILKMTPEIYFEVNKYSGKGKRVLVLAKADKIVNDKISGKTTLEAYIIIDDHVRDDARQTIDYFNTNGVDIRVISGDNAVTVSEISRKAGIKNYQNYISLDGLSNEDVIEATDKYTVFGRVVPEQKKLIIETLKASGKKVAMTGDGVNDILALKAADVSIAMASGSEAARNVSQLVLMDSNFSNMPRVVKEGRRVINNIEKVASLFLMKTVYSLMLVLLTLIVLKPYPFRPIQMTLIELLVIGIPGFMLALEKNTDIVTGKFIQKALKKALPGSIVVFLNISILYFFQDTLGLTHTEVSTISAVTTLIAGLIMLFLFCQPFNKYRTVLFLSMLTSSSLALIYLSDAFQVPINELSVRGILMMIILIQFSVPILLNLKKMRETGEIVLQAGERFLEKIDQLDEVI